MSQNNRYIFMENKTLKYLISKNKLAWVDSDITEANFPVQPQDKDKVEYKLYSFDRNISSEDAIIEMQKEGYEPTTLRQLLSWKDWNGEDWAVALGSVWRDGYGLRGVPVLGCDVAKRGLYLGWFEGDWGDVSRFLAVRKLTKNSKRSASKSLDTLTLDGEVIEIRGVKYKLTEL